MKISIVIPNYNGEELLKKNLPKLFTAISEHKDYEIIVVDDGSKDGSVNFLKSQNVIILKNSKNLGFSSTVNKGVKNAKSEIVFLLNSDAYPDKDFFKPILEDFKDPQVFAVGCLDKSLENGKVVLRGRGIGKWSKGFLVHSKGDINKRNTLWANGGSAAFRKSIWQKLGGFDEIYSPFYWEDIDISYRALKSGYKIIFDPKSVIFHDHSQGAIKRNYSQFTIRVISYRNQFIFVWKNATDFTLQIKHILFLPYHLARAFKNRDAAFFIGFFKALVLLPKIVKSSFNVQRQFVKKDKAVMKVFEK